MDNIQKIFNINTKMNELLKRENYFFVPKKRVISLNEYADKCEPIFNPNAKELFVDEINLPIYKFDLTNADESDKEFINEAGLTLTSTIILTECDLSNNVSSVIVMNNDLMGEEKRIYCHVPQTVYVKVPEYCVNKKTLIKLSELNRERGLIYKQLSNEEKHEISFDIQKTELKKQARQQDAKSLEASNIASVHEEHSKIIHNK